MSQNDSGFLKTFVIVFGALVVFTIFIAIVANIYSPKVDRSSDPLVQNELAKQIAPVGQNRVAADSATESTAGETETTTESANAVVADAPATEPVTPTATEATANATDTQAAAVAMNTNADIPVKVRAVVATNCAGCHQEGLQGAQRSDDADAWQSLQARGLAELTASVINGKGAMLPRAETSLNDEEIALAIQHMIAQATGTNVGSNAGDTTPVATADTATDTTTEQVAQTETDAAAPAAEIPANVKSTVDTLCAGCHISGVANAPKYGDKDAWASRMSVGMEKVLASAIAGKGAMPARGGSSLSDAELRLAIEYMLTK